MLHQIKKLLIQTGLAFFRGFFTTKKILVFVFERGLRAPFGWFFRKLWRYGLGPAVIGAMKSGLAVKKIGSSVFTPAQSKILSSLNSRYAVHAALLLLAAFTLTENLNAKETREETFGHASRLYSIAIANDLGATALQGESDTIEEGPVREEGAAPDPSANQPLSYLDQGLGVRSQPQPRAVTSEELDEESQISTSQGETALVRPQISNTVTNLARRDRPIEYAVEEGDTVSSIAAKFGVSVNTILWENKLTAQSYIRPGNKLVILPVTGISHSVKKGETVASIAKRYGVDSEKIVEGNRLADASDIGIGQKLMIPGGAPYSTPIRAVPANLGSVRNIFVPTPAAQETGTLMIWPTAWRIITQYYSWRHTGLDIDGNYNTPTYAADDGVVVAAGWNSGGYGLQIVIDHGNGIKTRYAHHSKIFVSVGERVGRGQAIGMVGTTGRSTGTHLHFEVMVNGSRVNPLRYIR